jgi:hypothetical protein
MIDAKHIKYLKNIVGEDDIKTDKAHLRAYSYDATKEHFYPEAVIFPENEEEVSKILRYCNENKIVIVPRGAGSGFTGGALHVGHHSAHRGAGHRPSQGNRSHSCIGCSGRRRQSCRGDRESSGRAKRCGHRWRA